MFKKRIKAGFTLIEIMIAMAIFVTFTGIMINSYTHIIKAQTEANDYRILYSEARQVFDKLTDEIRDSAIYYPVTNQSELILVKSGDLSTGEGGVLKFSYNLGEGKICYAESQNSAYYLNSDEVRIKEMNFFVSPLADPYAVENVAVKSLQFQPKVTFFGRFEKEISGGRLMEVDFHTTVSSRFYNEAPADLIIPDVDCSEVGGTLNELDF